VAPVDIATSDLCYEAADELIESLDWDRAEIGALIFVSQSADYYLPATSIILQDRLRLDTSCMAFDVGLGCSGYVYGLSILGSIMQASGIKKGLLLAGDVSSATCHVKDKSTFPLFGDAGSATALELDDNSCPLYFSLFSDGAGYKRIIIEDGGIRNRVSASSFDMKSFGPGIERTNLNLALDGAGVFHFSLKEVPPAIREICLDAQLTSDEIDYVILHQANQLINNHIERKLNFEHAEFPSSIANFGNTSSASIPLTMVTNLKASFSDASANVVLCGFGVGLSWATMCGRLGPIYCHELIEL